MNSVHDMNEEIRHSVAQCSQRHDTFPEHIREPLPPIDWQAAGIDAKWLPEPFDIQKDVKTLPNESLPAADYVVITWTLAEWAALNHVFCDYTGAMPVSEIGSKKWRKPWKAYSRDYYTIRQYMIDVEKTYQGGAPSLYDNAWGFIRMVTVGGRRVLLVKSSMHLAQDGTGLPLKTFVEKICDETAPELLLSIGTAGGVRDEDALGSVLVTNQAYFLLMKEFCNAPFNGETVTSDWKPADMFIEKLQKLLLPVSGFPVLPVSPQYPPESSILPDSPDSRIKVVTDRPIVTTDSFLFGTTTHHNHLSPDDGCIVEMDDAVVGMACRRKNIPFGFVRNISDPVINGNLPSSIQGAWAAYIYQELGIYTSFNGALATFALIAGEVARKESEK